MEIQKSELKTETLKEIRKITDEQRAQIYSSVSTMSKDTVDEVCPALLNVLLNSEKGLLKNELGRIIFHLQKNDRLNTIVGLEKLIDGALIVAPDEMFKILESSELDAQELAKKIKQIL